VVASVVQPDGEVRTSFAVETMSAEDRRRLEIWVIDAALLSLVPR
jgi:hypothetical protein